MKAGRNVLRTWYAAMQKHTPWLCSLLVPQIFCSFQYSLSISPIHVHRFPLTLHFAVDSRVCLSALSIPLYTTKFLPVKHGSKMISMHNYRACRFSHPYDLVQKVSSPLFFDLHFILYLAQCEEQLKAGRTSWMWILAAVIFHTFLIYHPTVFWQRLVSVHKQGCGHCYRRNRE